MIVNPNVTTYIHSLDRDGTEFLEQLREYAEREDVPIIRREMESFMKVILEMKKPEKILEIGAAIGYSAIFMAQCTSDECRITTIENYDKRIPLVKENVAACGLENRIKLLEGDAGVILPELDEKFDMVFLDAAKGQYMAFLPEILRLLNVGGILLADNVLQEGELAMSRYVTPRRQRTIHERMREFVWEVKHNECLETSVITIGDGVTLSIKTK